MPVNTATGAPGDGLQVSPAQIGIFDASYPLKRAVELRTATEQSIVDVPVTLAEPPAGWAASGVVGYDNARWIPLLESFDRFGRPRGAAGAMLLNYQGYYAGSGWIYFGVDNTDLFADADSPAARLLQQAVRFAIRKMFLRNVQTDVALYRDGERVHASVVVENRGSHEQRAEVAFTLGTAAGSPVAPRRCRRGK